MERILRWFDYNTIRHQFNVRARWILFWCISSQALIGCAGSPAATALQLLLPPIDKIAENVGVSKPSQEERTDTHTVFKKGEKPTTYKAGTKKKQEIKPSGNCSSRWVRKQYSKQGPTCYNKCNEVVSCN